MDDAVLVAPLRACTAPVPRVSSPWTSPLTPPKSSLEGMTRMWSSLIGRASRWVCYVIAGFAPQLIQSLGLSTADHCNPEGPHEEGDECAVPHVREQGCLSVTRLHHQGVGCGQGRPQDNHQST